MDLDEEEHLHSQLRTKGKRQTYLIRSDVLELKPRTRRQGKCLGAAVEVIKAEERYWSEMELAQKPKEYNCISDDIWFHLANYIAPEDVKRYALICTQSAYSISSRRFWLNLYRQYCQHSKDKKKWILELPAHLQMNQLLGCDVHTLRLRVIKSLFYCHTPFTESLKQDYKLETLVGRDFVSCWNKQTECVSIMCYNFRRNISSRKSDDSTSTLPLSAQNEVGECTHNWESLAEHNSNEGINSLPRITHSQQDDSDGVSLLLICCIRFIPFPMDFICANSTSSIRLAAVRELLSTDMRSTNLEIDLVALRGNDTVTWKYNKVLKTKVLPWWHPDYSTFIKCDGYEKEIKTTIYNLKFIKIER